MYSHHGRKFNAFMMRHLPIILKIILKKANKEILVLDRCGLQFLKKFALGWTPNEDATHQISKTGLVLTTASWQKDRADLEQRQNQEKPESEKHVNLSTII